MGHAFTSWTKISYICTWLTTSLIAPLCGATAITGPSSTCFNGCARGCSSKATIGASTSRMVLWEKTRSEEQTSELQSLMRISYAFLCLNKKIHIDTTNK